MKLCSFPQLPAEVTQKGPNFSAVLCCVVGLGSGVLPDSV